MPFKLAQTFFVDPAVVQNAAEIAITQVDLFFKSKPKPTFNKSGIKNPGVEVYLVGTKNSIPNVDAILSATTEYSRLEYHDIMPSADATEVTTFEFKRPVKLKTNKEYAIVVKCDGDEDFTFWTSKQGDLLLGTTKVSPGPSGNYIGSFYNYVAKPVIGSGYKPSNPNSVIAHGDDNVNPSVSDPWAGVNSMARETNEGWKSIKDTDLKFKVYCARYFETGTVIPQNATGTKKTSGGTPTGAGSYQFNLNPSKLEYVLFDRNTSKTEGMKGGERVYQRSVYYPGGFSNSSVGASQALSVSVTKGSDLITANTRLPNGALFSWRNVFADSGQEYIIVDVADYDNADKRITEIMKIVSIESDTVIRVKDVFTNSNNAAKFFISPVAKISTTEKSKAYGKNTDLLTLDDSNANLSVRFVNNTILSVSVKTAGSGYSNSDYLIINGYENIANKVIGGYPARANVVTNGSGAIQNIYLSNLGCGFVNTSWLVGANIVIANSTGGASSGTGAVFTYKVGATLGTEYHGADGKGGEFKDATIIDFEVGNMIPSVEMTVPSGTTYNMAHQMMYYIKKEVDTHLGKASFVHNDANKAKDVVKPSRRHDMAYDLTPAIPSRSNQFVITDSISSSTNSSSGGTRTTIEFSSNNDFVCVDIPPTSHKTTYSKYIINNDYTGENTDDGEAFAKHITKKINFADNKFAEDLFVYLTAYRPANTDIKVFARIHNSNDPEAFDDKDWTMLDIIDGKNVYSSPVNKNDYIELTYGFKQYPNTVLRVDGSAELANIETVIVTGSGSSYATNTAFKLQTGDLVKISSTLFPDSYIVRVVDSVSSDTQFTINKPSNTADIVGSGLRVDFLGRMGNSTASGIGYPLQAFNNITNDNVVRYFNSSMVEFDTYNTMQLKIVLLSDVTNDEVINVYPRVDDIRAVGVST